MNTIELTTAILMTNLINNTDTDISNSNNADIESSLCMALCNAAYCSGRLSVMIEYANELREELVNNTHLQKELLEIYENFLRTRKFSRSDKKKIMYCCNYARIYAKDLYNRKKGDNTGWTLKFV